MATGSYVYLPDDAWTERIAQFDAIARSCTLCPRNCRVDRFTNERGFCGAPGGLVVSSTFAHHGEEPPISGTSGSGTVFFSHCTLLCCFCQNWQLSHEAEGRPFTPDELAGKMLDLQEQGCHNINLVTATHFLPWVLRALRRAAGRGLTIPLVYNCGGYEHESIIALLGGIVDIYLPDMKYGEDGAAGLLSKAPDYSSFNRSSVREMFRQAGPLKIGEGGIARKGICIRHLVLPNGYAASESILEFLTSTFDPSDIHISLMAQYRPLFRAGKISDINRMVTGDEYEKVKTAFIDAGFPGYFQELSSMDQSFVIDFTKRKEEALTGEAKCGA